jgi:hypothetical protein
MEDMVYSRNIVIHLGGNFISRYIVIVTMVIWAQSISFNFI